VTLARDVDDSDDGDQTVVAPYKKLANWRLVVGDPTSQQLLVIKRVTVTKKSLGVKLEFTLPKGTHSLKLYVICDSYVGADHDIGLDAIEVAGGEDSDSDEDMDSDEDTSFGIFLSGETESTWQNKTSKLPVIADLIVHIRDRFINDETLRRQLLDLALGLYNDVAISNQKQPFTHISTIQPIKPTDADILRYLRHHFPDVYIAKLMNIPGYDGKQFQ
jgi:Sec63 Brl domain